MTHNAEDAVDDLIQIRIKMLKDEIQREKDAIKERLDLLRDFYQKQKDMLREQYEEENYLRDQQKKRKAIEDIMAELAALENDNSAWAQRRRLELMEQLAEAQEDLDNFEHDHALEMAEDELDKLQEMQEQELNDQLDALEEQENDAIALYEQALEDIRNGSIELYEEMIEWNRLYGDGIEDTIKDAWEAAYQALQDYMDLYGEWYQGIHLGNATNYDPGETWDDHPIHVSPAPETDSGSGSGGSGSNETPPPSSGNSYPYGKASETTGVIKKGDRGNKVKAIQWALNMLNFGNSGTNSLDGVFGSGTEAAVKAFQREMKITADGKVGNNTRAKFKLEGYRRGTSFATPGLHEIDEDKLGEETIFETANGKRYKMFSGGEKVLDAKASDFLYKFAVNGGNILQRLMPGLIGGAPGISLPVIKPINSVFNLGDIIIQGNADEQTVSEIRRAQRESLTVVLKQFNLLSK